MPFLESIHLYPIKSLNGVSVQQATVLENGMLQHDREFAMVGPDGKFINGKHNDKVHVLRSSFDATFSLLTIAPGPLEDSNTFHLEHDRDRIEKWLTDFFGFRVIMIWNDHGGFPDDTNASGPTVIGTGSLHEVIEWFPSLHYEQVRNRFRPNLVIGDAVPFWEDKLFDKEGTVVEFEIGNVRFEGVNPCQRCVVPTRDPASGEIYPDFQKRFMEKRKQTLPSWTEVSRFDHFYRLSVNTRTPPSEKGKTLRVGDDIKIIGMKNDVS